VSTRVNLSASAVGIVQQVQLDDRFLPSLFHPAYALHADSFGMMCPISNRSDANTLSLESRSEKISAGLSTSRRL